MTSKASTQQKPVTTGPEDYKEGDACQKYDNIWLCGNPEEVKHVIALLKAQRENNPESSPDDAEDPDYCSAFDDESGEGDKVEED